MAIHPSQPERRAPDRPRDGDVRPCPKCGAPLEFNQRYRFNGQVVPAWVCDSPRCRYSQPVRAGDGRRARNAE